jgi:hypothetical protein
MSKRDKKSTSSRCGGSSMTLVAMRGDREIAPARLILADFRVIYMGTITSSLVFIGASLRDWNAILNFRSECLQKHFSRETG